MHNKLRTGLVALGLTATSVSAAVLPRIDFPKDSPVAFLSADYGDSAESPRGSAMSVDLHAALSLRNSSGRRIRGITLVVTAQDLTPGGKGSVTVTSLDVAPGDSFPIRIDLRLLRPLQAASLPVTVGLDGVLFDDLSFYGRNGLNKLNSQRLLTASELEARRDRQYFKSVLAKGGPEELQKEVLAIRARQSDRSNPDVQMMRARATNVETEKQVRFAFLQLPDAPVEPLEGTASISGNEARASGLDVRNRSDRAVKYLEMGWILQDANGREFLAGSVPAQVSLAPGQKSAAILADTAFRFRQPLSSDKMTGYVSSVEFSDGSMWVPSRKDLSQPQLRKVVGPSAEEQRLLQVYARRGLKGLAEELNKF